MLLQKLLVRLRVAPFEGRWTPQIIEQNALENDIRAADQGR